jgi:CDP-diacylglycerol--glycerol-3-phosphate 3-phosphatidyltransferase
LHSVKDTTKCPFCHRYIGCYPGSLFFLGDNKNLGIVLIFLGSAVDGLDGPLARTLNKTTKKGALLDSTIDRIGELFIWAVIGINYVSSNIELFTIFSIVTSSSLIPYLRAKSEVHGIDNKVGIAARPERVLFAVFYMYFQFSFNFVYLFALAYMDHSLATFYQTL